MNKKQLLIFSVLLPAVIGAGAGLGLYKYRANDHNSPPNIQGLLWPEPKQLTSFTTIDQSGNRFGLDRLYGKWSFLFFGYTHCPDICPVTIAVLNRMLELLNEQNKPEQVQMIFVTVDHERDTSARLKEYLNYFNEDIIGLGGTAGQIQSLASQIGIVHIVGEKSDSGEYFVDHSASVFLIDPAGRLVSVFSAPHSAENILSRYERIRDFIEQQLSS